MLVAAKEASPTGGASGRRRGSRWAKEERSTRWLTVYWVSSPAATRLAKLANCSLIVSFAVIGTNGATKQLSKFLDCTKEYRAIGLLGCATDSLDSDGKRVRLTPFDHVTADKVKAVLDQFRGEIEQTPPMCVCAEYRLSFGVG